ncbi:hypothetical protein [Euzebya tangerina]|uniref:hypothetical protein n=1 Tax=Euzebya tangerina TaxID=591198 RepID=UPI000E322009|nr:hypothetical protein [Euzebya tangerina]
MRPTRLTGRALQLSAKAAGVPVLAAGVRAVGRPLLGLDELRDARLGPVQPDLGPPRPERGPGSLDAPATPPRR